MSTPPPSHDAYVATFPLATRQLLDALRALVREVAPEATETFAYGIPTFDLHGRHLVHFAGYAGHVGFYPTGSGIEAFRDELVGYRTSRGTVQLPLDQPLPVDLLRRMVAFRVGQCPPKKAKR